jgi:hypothetical protein
MFYSLNLIFISHIFIFRGHGAYCCGGNKQMINQVCFSPCSLARDGLGELGEYQGVCIILGGEGPYAQSMTVGASAYYSNPTARCA